MAHKEALPEDIRREESDKLRALWKHRKGKISQAEFAEKYGLGTQGNLAHYLHGRRPLNLEVAELLAGALGCHISDFSPRLAAKQRAARALSPWPFSLITPTEWEHMSPGRKLTAEGKLLDWLAESDGSPSKRRVRQR